MGGGRVNDLVPVSLHEKPNGLYFYVTAEPISRVRNP
jgi:hypothetical protein